MRIGPKQRKYMPARRFDESPDARRRYGELRALLAMLFVSWIVLATLGFALVRGLATEPQVVDGKGAPGDVVRVARD